MFAKWPIHAEKASLRRVNAVWLSRSERRACAYSTLRPPTFSGDSLASAVLLTVRPNGVMKLQDVILKAMAGVQLAKKLSWGGPVGNRVYSAEFEKLEAATAAASSSSKKFCRN